MIADRQTQIQRDRQTDTLITILRSPIGGGEVIQTPMPLGVARRAAWNTSLIRTESITQAQLFVVHDRHATQACSTRGRLGSWDVSYTSIVHWVETIRITHAEGRGRPGGANVRNHGYHFNMSINLKIREQQSCAQLTIRGNTTIQDVNSAFSPSQSVLNFCLTALHRCSAVDVVLPCTVAAPRQPVLRLVYESSF